VTQEIDITEKKNSFFLSDFDFRGYFLLAVVVHSENDWTTTFELIFSILLVEVVRFDF